MSFSTHFFLPRVCVIMITFCVSNGHSSCMTPAWLVGWLIVCFDVLCLCDDVLFRLQRDGCSTASIIHSETPVMGDELYGSWFDARVILDGIRRIHLSLWPA